MSAVILSISGGFALIYLLGYCWAAPVVAGRVFKTASVLGLALTGALGGGPWLLVLALLASAIGDFQLGLPDRKGLLTGMAAFGAAHVAYLALFAAHAHRPWSSLAADPVAWAMVLLALSVPLWLLPRTGSLRVPVAVYVTLIVAMGLAARLVGGGVALGAGLFILSDLVLSVELFVLSTLAGMARAIPFVVWAAYWAGQATLTWALLSPG